MVAAVVIGAVFLLGMVAAAAYGAWMLPSGARVPLNAGVPEYSVWLPKPVGLAAWLGVGAAAFAAVGALTLSGLAANWEQSTRFVLLPGVMMVVLAGEASALIVARRCAADRLGAAPYYDPLITLALLAKATTRARLGTSVLVLPYLRPFPVAKELATIDHVSGGRLEIGVGVGGLQVEHDAVSSVPYAQRGRYSDEFIEVMKQLWTGEPSSSECP